ncbi:MAG TPA: hypothetical protein VGG99_19340 [Acetobacteraceae bacterium]
MSFKLSVATAPATFRPNPDRALKGSGDGLAMFDLHFAERVCDCTLHFVVTGAEVGASVCEKRRPAKVLCTERARSRRRDMSHPFGNPSFPATPEACQMSLYLGICATIKIG